MELGLHLTVSLAVFNRVKVLSTVIKCSILLKQGATFTNTQAKQGYQEHQGGTTNNHEAH